MPRVTFHGFAHTDHYRGSVADGMEWRPGDAYAVSDDEAAYLVDTFGAAFTVEKKRPVIRRRSRRKRGDISDAPADRMEHSPPKSGPPTRRS